MPLRTKAATRAARLTIALSLAETENVDDLVPELLIPIVRRLMAAGTFDD